MDLAEDCKQCLRNPCAGPGKPRCADCEAKRAEGARLKREKIERLDREGK